MKSNPQTLTSKANDRTTWSCSPIRLSGNETTYRNSRFFHCNQAVSAYMVHETGEPRERHRPPRPHEMFNREMPFINWLWSTRPLLSGQSLACPYVLNCLRLQDQQWLVHLIFLKTQLKLEKFINNLGQKTNSQILKSINNSFYGNNYHKCFLTEVS